MNTKRKVLKEKPHTKKKPAIPKWRKLADKFRKEGKLQQIIDSIDTEAADIEASEKHILKAQLLCETCQFDDAGEHYIRASAILPSYENNFAAANFFQDQNRFKEAEDYYTRCLIQATSPEERAGVLNNLGEVQYNLNDYPQAEASFTEALQTYKELAATNPQAYLPDVATTLNNLGNLQTNTNNYSQAEASYAEALQIRRKLAATNPQAYRPHVADTLNNLGILQTNTNNYPQAEASFTEALQIDRELAATNPQAYLPNVAATLNNLGILQTNTNNYPRAEASFTEVLQIRKKLAATNRQAYLPGIAATLNNLGYLHEINNEYPQAGASYTEALQTYKELAATNPQAYLPDVTETLANLSLLYKSGAPDEALSLQYAKEVLEILDRYNDTPWVQEVLGKARRIIYAWERQNYPR